MTRDALASPQRRPTTRIQANEAADTTSAELSAVRHLFAAIEAGIRATAPRSALRGMLATLRDQQRATEAEVIERGKRRRQFVHEMRCAAQAAFAKQKRRPERPPRKTRRFQSYIRFRRVN